MNEMKNETTVHSEKDSEKMKKEINEEINEEIDGNIDENIWAKIRSRAMKIVKNKAVQKIFAAFCGVVGIVVLSNNLFDGYPTDLTWMLGVWSNLFLSVAVIVFLSAWLRKKYKNWIPADEHFYEEWKEQYKRQQQILLGAFLVLMLVAWWIYINRYNGLFYSYYVSNNARFYLLFATAILQCAISETLVVRFMMARLDMYMARINEINQDTVEQALARALEIEKTSMEKVSRSDQLRMDLITNVSHDLKTPLTSMVGYVELLKKEELSDTARDYLEVISNRAGKLKEMIESLFTLAKVSSGNVELKKEHLTLNRLIEQLFADMQDKVQQSGLEFVTVLSKEDTGLIADNGYMYRICQNLLENALKYSAKGTRVFVTTSVLSEGADSVQHSANQTERGADGAEGLETAPFLQKICLEITNTAGYHMDFQKEDIVERFARADKARSTEGNGLGLAIVSTYAKALGGEFDIFIDCDQFKARLVFPKAQEG